jgi:hypothetical protein
MITGPGLYEPCLLLFFVFIRAFIFFLDFYEEFLFLSPVTETGRDFLFSSAVYYLDFPLGEFG